MMEVIHDLAPGAELAFAAATDSDSLFSAIRWLIDVHDVDVIVSDLNDYSENFFGRDALTQLIEDEIDKHDVVYVQAAGNDGERTYQEPLFFDTRTLPGESTPRTLHRFGGTPSDPSSILPVTLEANSSVRFVLQTDQSTRDPDAQIVLGTFDLPGEIEVNRVGFSVDNPGSRDRDVPLTVDSFVLTNRASDPVIVNLTVDLVAGQLPSRRTTEFRIVALGDAQMQTVRGPQLFGAALAENALVVGAMDAAATSKAADYSSFGDVFGRNVDVVGPAGIEVSGFGTRFKQDFFGSSSGAAHVGAIAALLRAVKTDATSTEIRDAIKQTAKPLGSGVGDLQSGFGLIDASAAAQQLDPITIPPEEPEPREVSEGADWLNELVQFVEVITPSGAELQGLFSAAQPVATELLRLRLRLDGDSVGAFAAEFPFLFDGIAGFDAFEISGSVGVEATPDVLLQFGWDDVGWYLESDTARLGLELKGHGKARGVAFDQFGVGVEGTLTGKPYIDVAAIDRAGDGRIRQDDIDALQSDLTGGDVTLVLPKLDEIDAEVTGDLILGFLDYVDVDPKLPNRPNGGDPFIVRGKAKLNADLTGSIPAFAFEELRLANPDIDGDDRPDYTLGALARNAILYGDELLNSLDIPGFANDLLGKLGLGNASRNEALERPRGMLPDEPLDTGEAIAARQAINSRVATALSTAGNDGSAVDQQALQTQIAIELDSWLSAGESSAAEGESANTSQSILERLRIIELDIESPQIDDPSTAVDEFEVSLNEALSSYERWIAAVESAGLTPEEATTAAKLQRLQTRLVNALRYAIQRAHVGAIQLHLDGAPLNHQYDINGNVTQRGVFDRAVEAVFWAQSAEFLGLEEQHPELSVARAYEDMVIRANIKRAELVVPAGREIQDAYIGPDDSVHLDVETSWQIKLPSNGAPDISTLFPTSTTSVTYDFGPEIADADGNLEILSIGDGNNNQVAGEAINRESAFFIPLPLTGALSPVPIPLAGDLAPTPIARGFADANGEYQTNVLLGEGDTQAQVSIHISLNRVPIASQSTNVILGRPTIELFAAESYRDDSALRQSDLFVTPGSEFAIQVRAQRGNGPLAGELIVFSEVGYGNIDSLHPLDTKFVRTASDGRAIVHYSVDSIDDPTEGSAVIASYFDGGTQYIDSIAFQTSGYSEFEMGAANPFAGFVPSDDADSVALRESVKILADHELDELTDAQRSNLAMLVDNRAAALSTQADNAFNGSLLLPVDIEVVAQSTKQAVVDYLEWIALATAAGRADSPMRESIESALTGATGRMAFYWLSEFDGTAASGGLKPFYQAHHWGKALDILIERLPNIDTTGLLTTAKVIEQSGIEIEFLSTPKLLRDGDLGRFEVGARIVKVLGDQSTRVVEHEAGIVAPLTLQVIPTGLAQFEFDSSAHVKASTGATWLNSRLEKTVHGSQTLVPSGSLVGGTATPAEGDRELTLNVAYGVPGIVLTTQSMRLRRPAQVDLQAKIKNDNSSAFADSLTMTSTQRAVLRAGLTVEDTPVDGEVAFHLIGRGELNETIVRTGNLGFSTAVEFTPPVRPEDFTDDTGVSLISVRSVINGVVTTDYVTLEYEFRAGVEGNNFLGTPDYLRASEELETALRNQVTSNPETGGPEIDEATFSVSAVEYLRDWISDDASDATGEGNVVHWLSQVQSYANYPQDLDWNEAEFERDEAFRNAFDEAIENWLRWHSTVAMWDLDPQLIAPQQVSEAAALVVGAFRHAIERVHDRCTARATEYRNAPDSTPAEQQAKEVLLERLILEGGQAVRYYSEFEPFTLFEGINIPEDFQLGDVLGQLCYQVEFVENETYLDGSPENAQVRVQAGVRVDGVNDLILPTRRMPLLVVINPVGNASLDGIGAGRTDENGVFDRVSVSAGPREATVAVDATVIFATLEEVVDEPDDSALLPQVRSFATKRLTLDNTVQSGLLWSPPARSSTLLDTDEPSASTSSVEAQTRSLRGEETAEVEFTLRRGRAPLIGKFVEITLLGEGELDVPVRITDTSGRIRFRYTAPKDQTGRARIGVSYSVDGETFTETATIDYSDVDSDSLDPVFSSAQLTAEGSAALLISQASQQVILGNDGTLDDAQLADILRTWRDSGINPDGSLNSNQDCGVRCHIAEVSNSSIDARARFLERASIEFFRWMQVIDQLDLSDELTAPAEPDVLDALSSESKTTIDTLVQSALETRDATRARSAMRVATLAETSGLLATNELDVYGVDAVRRRLGYEIRIDDATLHGEADDGWLQVSTRLYLRDLVDAGQLVPAQGSSPIDVDVLALGFSLVNPGEVITDGVFGSEVSITRGDTDLRLIVHARDEYSIGDTFEIERSGKTSFAAGTRLASNELASLEDQIELFANQQAHLEGVVTRGLGRDRTRDVLFTVEGAPQDSVQRIPGRSDAFVFTPPEGQSGTATITLSLHADGTILQSGIEIVYSDQTGPEGEVIVESHCSAALSGPESPTLPEGECYGSGLLNNSHAVGAFNQVDVPLAASGDTAKVGNAFGLDSFQFPFDGGLPSFGEFRSDVGNWFNDSFDLLHIADLETLLGFLNGLPAQPEDIVRFKFDAAAAVGDPGTLLAADFSGLLPDGFEGSIRLDKPELSGQIVFGIDTSSSPLYVLTQPDQLLTNNPTFEDFLNGGVEKARVAGLETTQLGAKFGVAANFRSSGPLIDGILDVPFAEGYLSSKLDVDFSEVAKSTGKLRLNNLAELANLKVGFDGSAIDTFQAIASARVTLPNLAGINDDNHPLANVEVVGAIHKPSLDTTDIAREEALASDTPWEFQLRTADLFQLDANLKAQLSTDVVAAAGDVLEPNDDWEKIGARDAANLGLLSARTQHQALELADSADWYRFETGETGDASNFVRVDFDSLRGDLDLSLYRLVDSELVHVRTDDLSFSDTASITLLGQPQGTYFVKVFDNEGALQPYYALTIEPPGKLQPGIQAQIGDFQILDTSLSITVDTNLEFSGFLDGRVVMNFAAQDEKGTGVFSATEVGFRASIDTVADDRNENGGIYAELTTELGNEAIQTLALQDDNGSLIPPPSRFRFESWVDPDVGGYLIFDYKSATDFKFAGLDASNNRFVIGAYDEEDGWVVPDNTDSRVVGNIDPTRPFGLVLLFDGQEVTLATSDGRGDPATVLTKSYAAIPTGDLGLGTPDGIAKFYDAYLYAGSDRKLIFTDFFNQNTQPQWKLSKGVWSIDDTGRWVARGSSLTFGEVLHIDSAVLRGFIDIQFNDNNILAVPAINPQNEDDGKIEVGFELSDVNALLFIAEDGGTPLYDDVDDSPHGKLAINNGFLTLGPTGLSLGAGEVRAVIADVLHVDVTGAEFNLTNDPSEPLFATSDIGIRIPSLSTDTNFVTISGADPNPEARIFGISQPSPGNPIPDFLLFQDTIEINFDTGLLQKKFIDVGGVFPFTLDRVGIRFNDAGDETGKVGNLSDFDLLVAGQIDFTNSIFDGLPFDPIFAIGQRQPNTAENERQIRLSGSNAYVDSCDTTLIESVFGNTELCQNGFVSAELGLGSLLGNDTPLIKNLGPIFIGFQNLNLFREGDAIEDPQQESSEQNSDGLVDGGLNIHGLPANCGFPERRVRTRVFWRTWSAERR